MSAYITEYNGKYIVSKTISSLCRNLTNKGLNIPDHVFIVNNFYTNKEYTRVRYDADKDVWMQYVPELVIPERVIPAYYRQIKATKGLKNNLQKVKE